MIRRFAVMSFKNTQSALPHHQAQSVRPRKSLLAASSNTTAAIRTPLSTSQLTNRASGMTSMNHLHRSNNNQGSERHQPSTHLMSLPSSVLGKQLKLPVRDIRLPSRVCRPSRPAVQNRTAVNAKQPPLLVGGWPHVFRDRTVRSVIPPPPQINFHSLAPTHMRLGEPKETTITTQHQAYQK